MIITRLPLSLETTLPSKLIAPAQNSSRLLAKLFQVVLMILVVVTFNRHGSQFYYLRATKSHRHG